MLFITMGLGEELAGGSQFADSWLRRWGFTGRHDRGCRDGPGGEPGGAIELGGKKGCPCEAGGGLLRVTLVLV